MKGRALRRALATADAYRIGGAVDLPKITDTTELITPEVAYAILVKNTNNRPVNWQRVEEYAEIMRKKAWELHAQGIVLDVEGNVLTGQKRLWAVIYSGVNVWMRVSRGNPKSAARLLDRGVPQSARDLASRGTGKKHSPIEASLARAVLVLRGNLRPSIDALAETIEANAPRAATLLAQSAGTRKTRAVLMVLGAVLFIREANATHIANLSALADTLEDSLRPQSAAGCWGKGAAFTLAMQSARRVVEHAMMATTGG